MEKELLEAYRQIFKSKNNEPSWAVHKTTEGHTNELVHCPIPFVGKNYAKQNVKVLLYASAENLVGYKDTDKLYCDELAINRHRNYFNDSVLNSDSFFPNVHIAPINDGSLLTVALYIYLKITKLEVSTPKDFLEMISFGNYCKYTATPKVVKGKMRNEDYVRNRRKLKESHEYIKKDIEVLKPDYIIMFGCIRDTERAFIDKVKGDACVIPIYQINATTINTKINKDERYTVDKNNIEKHLGELEEVIQCWYKKLNDNKISGDTKKNYLSVFPYVDDVLKKEGILS